MGNTQNQTSPQQKSSLEYGGIYFQLNKPIIIPNETVSGTVYLQIKQNFEADDLIFKIFGYEKAQFVEWEDTGSGDDRSTQMVFRNATRTFINTQIKIYNWTGTGFIPPGQYSFPFQFLLPSGLPGSLYFVHQMAYAQISYELTAFLKPTSKTLPEIQYTSIAQVRELPSPSIQTGQAANINTGLKCCCGGCISNGSLNMTTFFEKNAYAPEEVASIATDIDCTKASCDVQVAYNLTQSVKLIAGVYSQDVKVNIVNVDLGRILKGEKWVGDKRKFSSLKLPAQSSPNSDMFYNEAIVDMKKVQGTGIQTIAPTANGTIVKSNFTLNYLGIVLID